MIDCSKIPRLPGIYKLINIVNNKIYIGSSINLHNRIKRHLYDFKYQCHPNIKLLRACNKYGIDMFDVEIINIFENISKEKLLKLEEELIIKNDCINNGYNLIINNSDMFKSINKDNNHILKNINNQSIAVIAFDIKTGNIINRFNSISDAARFLNTSSSNISRICKGYLNYIKGCTFCYEIDYDVNKSYIKKHHALNKKFTKEHINNLRSSSEKNKGIKVYKFDNIGNLLKIYNSIRRAERENNIKYDTLRNYINKETSFGGYFWKTNK